MGHQVAGVHEHAASLPDAPPEPVAPLAPPAAPGRRGVAELAVGFGIALVALAGFALLAGHLYDQEAVALDTVATPFVRSIQSPAMDGAMNGLTSMGSAPVLALVAAVAVAVLVLRRGHAKAAFLLAAICGSVALNGTLKVAVQRPRPVLPWAHVLPDYSFPSGHTMNALVLYLAIALIIWVSRGRRVGAAAVIVALGLGIAVGISRIYLGYHYLSDVAGGIAAGLAWLLVVALAFETIPRAWGLRQGHARRTGPAT